MSHPLNPRDYDRKSADEHSNTTRQASIIRGSPQVAATENLMLLTTVPGKTARKVLMWKPAENRFSPSDFNSGFLFDASAIPIECLNEVEVILETYATSDNRLIVSGDLTDHGRAEVAEGRLIRRWSSFKDHGDKVTLQDARRRLCIVDIDKASLPPNPDFYTAEGRECIVRHAIRECLPEVFHDATCVWQFSAQAGTDGHARLHLFFWLSQPAYLYEIKEALALFKVDLKIYSPEQPLYFCNPVIKGAADPMPVRIGLSTGKRPDVALPESVKVTNTSIPGKTNGTRRAGQRSYTLTDFGGLEEVASCKEVRTYPGADVIDDMLTWIGHGTDFDGNKLRGYHDILLMTTMYYAARVLQFGVDERDDEAVVEDIQAAMRDARLRDGHDISRYTEAEIKRHIDGAFAFVERSETPIVMPPLHKMPGLSTVEARAFLVDELKAYFRRQFDRMMMDPSDWPGFAAEYAGLKCIPGLGKTVYTVQFSCKYLIDLRQTGRKGRLLLIVRTLDQGEEARRLFENGGVKAAIMRGRDADLPNGMLDPADTEKQNPPKMCRIPQAAKLAITLGESVEASVCGGTDIQPPCVFKETCAYQIQKERVRNADVVIVAGDGLFRNLPSFVTDGLTMVVVDESCWQSALKIDDEIAVATFTSEIAANPCQGKRATYRTDRLTTAAKKIVQMLITAPDAHLSKKALLVAGLTARECDLCANYERTRFKRGLIRPNMDKRDIQRIGDGTKSLVNIRIPRRISFWEQAAETLRGSDDLNGRVELTTSKSGERFIRLYLKREINPELAHLPILHLDACMDLEIARLIFPGMTLLADVTAKTPFAHIIQFHNVWAKNTLIKKTPDGKKLRRQVVSKLLDFIRLNSRGNALVITHKDAKSWLAGDEFDDTAIRTLHYNAMAGLDAFGNVATAFIVSKPLPNEEDIRAYALALTGKPIDDPTSRIEERGALMSDGSGLGVKERVYTNEWMERVRVATCVAEVVQGIGRARAVNRSEDSILTIYVFADVCLPMPVNEIVLWGDHAPDCLDRQAARGMVFVSAQDAYHAHCEDGLFVSADGTQAKGQAQAAKAIQRALKAGPPCRERIAKWAEGTAQEWVEYEYRPEGDAPRRCYLRSDRVERAKMVLRPWHPRLDYFRPVDYLSSDVVVAGDRSDVEASVDSATSPHRNGKILTGYVGEMQKRGIVVRSGMDFLALYRKDMTQGGAWDSSDAEMAKKAEAARKKIEREFDWEEFTSDRGWIEIEYRKKNSPGKSRQGFIRCSLEDGRGIFEREISDMEVFRQVRHVGAPREVEKVRTDHRMADSVGDVASTESSLAGIKLPEQNFRGSWADESLQAIERLSKVERTRGYG